MSRLSRKLRKNLFSVDKNISPWLMSQSLPWLFSQLYHLFDVSVFALIVFTAFPLYDVQASSLFVLAAFPPV